VERGWSRRRIIGAGIGVGAGLALSGALGRAGTLATAPALAASDDFDADVGLDAGHSRVDVGASGAGVGEYAVTLDVAFRLQPLLESAGLRVVLTRTDDGPLSSMSHPDPIERVRIEQAARIAAVGNARIYVSIHFNGGPASLHGTETYYNADNHGTEGQRLAEAIHRSMLAELLEVGYATRDRGAKSDLTAGKPYGHFFMLRGPMPSVCGEALFLSNPTEGQLLLREEVRQAVAKGYAGGILEFFAGG
jgi:N-acetylmuramoyl-L-alanine amidase